MARTKSEPVPPVADLPTLPSDVATASLPPLDAETTEMPSPAVAPPSDAPATPEPITLLDLLRHKAETEKLDIEVEWDAIVKKLATDSATEAEVTAVLTSSGRSLSDLETAVNRQRRIIHLQTLVDDLPEAEAAHRDARAVCNAIKAEHKRHEKEMELEMKLLARTVNHTDIRMRRAQEARSELARMSFDFRSRDLPPETPLASETPRPIHHHNRDWRH